MRKLLTGIGFGLVLLMMVIELRGLEDQPQQATTAKEQQNSPAFPGMVFVEGGTLPCIGNGEITVSSFSIGRHEVTWGEWREVRAWAVENGYDLRDRGKGSGDRHPVHSVSWHDAVKWCNARSEMEDRTPVYMAGGAVYRSRQHNDLSIVSSAMPSPNWVKYRSRQHNDLSIDAGASGYRLPTDAEWEYAARGGNRSKGYKYSGSDDVDEVAWHGGNSSGAEVDMHKGRGTWPVGQKDANELGLHDMSGNVWEWCFDWHPSFEGSSRVARGGGWFHSADRCRSAFRVFSVPHNVWLYLGFRVALPSAVAP